MVKLNYITIMVRDIEKSIQFYKNLVGLNVIRRFNPGMGDIAFLGNSEGETMLELIQFENVDKVIAKGITLSFTAEKSLEMLREKAISMGYNASEIIDRKPKPKHFLLFDPDGIAVEFGV